MKQIWSSILAICLTASAVWAEGKESGWLTDHKAAQQQAKEEKKLLLMDFTGSDWCSWCIKLHKEVFSQKDFVAYAKDNLILLEVDFPQNKPQAKALKKTNEALQKKYNVEGYPTIIVLDGEGKQLGTLGYQAGGPGPFIEKLKALKMN